nr:MAG TPA: hypothetical protein [Caudoviricetes sp.]
MNILWNTQANKNKRKRPKYSTFTKEMEYSSEYSIRCSTLVIYFEIPCSDSSSTVSTNLILFFSYNFYFTLEAPLMFHI